MTRTRRWLEGWRGEIARRELGLALLFTAAATLGVLTTGVVLGRLGVYQVVPLSVVVAWLGAVATVVWGVRRYGRRMRRASVYRLAESVESLGKLRRGSVEGVVDESTHGSQALFDVADVQASSWLGAHGNSAVAPVRASGIRTLRLSAVAGLLGVSLFTLSGPNTGRGATFWHPIAILNAARGAVIVTLDRDEVRRGESVSVSITAVGRREATLWTRSPGEPWSTTPIELDSVGHASTTVGPLDSDRFFRAVSGRGTSETVQVRVAFPAFLSDIVLSAEYPAYLERPDAPLYPGDSAYLPVGTALRVRGRATLPINSALWRVAGVDTVGLDVDGSGFSGRAIVRRGGDWELVVSLEGGRSLEDSNPVLHVVAVPDSAPQIAVPVPGVDTTVAPSLRQLLVIDARDDNLLTRVEVTLRRAGRMGTGEETATDTIPLPVGGTDRAVLQWALNLNDLGFVAGDTAYYHVRAFDNAPNRQSTASREYALYLPSVADIRKAVRDAASDLVTDTDSLLRAQRDLAEETRNLAAEGARPDETGGEADDRMDFRSAEEAAEISEEQQQLVERAKELVDQLQELAESGWEAGITDPEWHKRLMELQEMLERAITPEMQETLQQLQQALEQLDAESVQEMLERLADAQEQLREQLERSRELFERAALEGQMSTLADDAEDLSKRQEEWNEAVGEGEQSDSSLAAQEEALSDEAQKLQDELQQLQEALDQAAQDGERVQQSQERTGQAMQQMQQAAQQASQGQNQQAQQSGQSASQNLDPVASDLRQQLEEMRQDWREEVLGMMDAALVETADLAERQESVGQRLQRGESGADVRGDQAAIREGVDRVIERLQGAAGKNALVSPELSTALGLSRLKMTEALQELQEATPNTRQAGDRAGQAVDGLNEVAYALLRNRGDVEGSESGSGMSEAMEQMAQMAQDQQAMAAEGGQMMPMMAQGQQEMLQQMLQELAERQRQLGQELLRMDAEGGPKSAEELAAEALELARILEAGQLDRETVERQEQLFRRLLDAGRTLRSDEEDEKEERRSETGDQTNVRLPPALLGPTGPEARFAYPKWEELRRFSPEERRLILDYFRRLNAERGRR